jgi:GNAT superfamily N-acetyltransferase
MSMEPTPALDVTIVTDVDATRPLADLVNEVYRVGESGLWLDGVDRTSAGELAENIAEGKIAGAVLDGALVGCVRLRAIDEQTAEFGMLSARPELQGIGVGRALVAFVESRAIDGGFVRMQLELVKPRGWKHPAKEILHSWYERLGYVVVSTNDFATVEPSVEPFLVTPCDFLVLWKTL